MLHELLEYARREGLASEPGFKARMVRWLLVFDPQGRWVGLQDLASDDKKSKGRMFAKCPDLTQPEMVAAGKGTRHFLVDGVDKVTLLTKEEKVTAKLASEHAFFIALLRQASPDLAILGPIADTLSDGAQLEMIRAKLQEHKAKPTDMITFAVTDPAAGLPDILVQGDAWHDWWRGFRAGLLDARQAKTKKNAEAKGMRCLLSGEVVSPASTHPKITGLSDVGGLSMGDALTSFDKESFGSYNLAQGQNAAISDIMAATYTGALNDLIRNRSKRLAGLKIAYWYSGQVKAEDDVLAEMMQGAVHFDGLTPNAEEADDATPDVTPGEAYRSESRAAELLEAIRTGTRPDLQGARFYALTLSANSGRVVIRDWVEGSFESLVESVNQWFEDLSIGNLSGAGLANLPSFERVLVSGLPERKPEQNYENWLAPVASQRQALWRVASDHCDVAIPRTLVQKVARRFATDIATGSTAEALNTYRDSSLKLTKLLQAKIGRLYVQAALIKAYLNREHRINKIEGIQMEAYLNESHPRAAYHCGRLMAVLQMIQRQAQGKIGTTIAQSHYAAAASRPVIAIPQLKTKTQHHLAKIEPMEFRLEFQRLLTQIDGAIGDAIPRTFDLEDQCFFHLGYYQQLAYEPYTEPAQRHVTSRGEKVRSLSEVIVANLLDSLNLTYAYEKPLVLLQGDKSVSIRPDFTITRDGKPPIYVEHLGMMDNFTYRSDWKKKEGLYSANGITQGGNAAGSRGTLITTMPERRTIDCQSLRKSIELCVAQN